MNLVALLPARYAKAITSLIGSLIVYLQLYGATWHLVPAMTMIAAGLGVAGVPNAAKPNPGPRVPTS